MRHLRRLRCDKQTVLDVEGKALIKKVLLRKFSSLWNTEADFCGPHGTHAGFEDMKYAHVNSNRAGRNFRWDLRVSVCKCLECWTRSFYNLILEWWSVSKF